MKNGRHTSILVLVLASVFLCLLACSCGIPTYISPTVSFSNVNVSDLSDEFTVKYKCDDVVGESGKIGLILLYYIGDTTNLDDSAIISKFKSNYKVGNYDGVVISPELDAPLYEIVPKVSTSESKVYAFSLDGKAVQAPTYVLSMDTSGDFTNNIKLVYDDETKAVSIHVDDVLVSDKLGLHESFTPVSNQCIRLFAAVSVQSRNFSNLFWSDLSYVGYIKID